MNSTYFCINCQTEFQTDEERQTHSALSCPGIGNYGLEEEEEIQPPIDILTQEITDAIDGHETTVQNDEIHGAASSENAETPSEDTNQLHSLTNSREEDPNADSLNPIVPSINAERHEFDEAHVEAEKTTKHDDDNDYKKIIAGFCVDAPCNKVKEILRLYSPDKSYDEQKAAFKSFKKGDIVKTLQFLGKTQNWDTVKKPDCVHELVYRIQNLMPETCGFCSESYLLKITDPSILSCSKCRQEVHHQCYKPILQLKNSEGRPLVEVLRSTPGFHFLCQSCEEAWIPDDELSEESVTNTKTQQKHQLQPHKQPQQPLHKPSAAEQQQHPNISSSTTTTASTSTTPTTTSTHQQQQQQQQQQRLQQQQQKQLRQLQQQQQQNNDDHHLQTSDNHDSIPSFSHTKRPPPLNVLVQIKDGSRSVSAEGNEASQDNNTTQTVCNDYINNKCKFGISGKGCQFQHPKRCSKLMNHGTRASRGCNLGKKCKDFHPKMCPTSITKSVCYDLSCLLNHVKGTARKKETQRKPSEKDASTSTKRDTGNEENPVPIATKIASPSPASSNQAFLDQIHLLKKELQEVMDKKFATLMQSQATQQFPQLIPQSLPQQQQQQQPIVSPPMQCFRSAPIPWMPPFYPMQHSPQAAMMGYY